jgi:hypothetical protein
VAQPPRAAASGGVGNAAERVGLASAASAAHGQRREAFAACDARDDLARLLQADVDLHRETRGAETAFMTRQHAAHGRRYTLRALLRAKARRTQSLETALV